MKKKALKRRNTEMCSPLLEIRVDSKTIVGWVNGHGKPKTWEITVATAQNLQWEWWVCEADLRQRVADWAVHIFREHNKEAAVMRTGAWPEFLLTPSWAAVLCR